MSPSSLWDRVRRARIVQVLVFYVGASWVVLQVAEILQEALSLPDWVLPVAMLLLLIGLIIITATAWVQGHAEADTRETTGEVPGSWEMDLKDIGESLARGRLPHLTWTRAIAGGIAAFLVLFGLSGLYVTLTGRGPVLGPAEAGADEAGVGLAVVPFTINGQGIEYLQEGLIDLLGNNLDGAGGLRAIDSRTVLARWREAVRGSDEADLRTILGVGAATGARFVLVGGAVSTGGQVRLTADVYDVDTGEEIGAGSAMGPPDDIMRVVDDLSVDVARVLLAEGGGDLPPLQNTASLTSSSLPALRAFLEAEALQRRSDFYGAIEALERAVAEDSTFALANMRLAKAYGWVETVGSERGAEALAAAERHRDRLPAREALYLDGEKALTDYSLEALDMARTAVRRYPDDPEAWYLLGEALVHLGPMALLSESEGAEAFARAIDLDAGFAPLYIHPMDQALAAGDSGAAARLLATYDEVAAESDLHDRYRLFFDALYGDASTLAQVRSRLISAEFSTFLRFYIDIAPNPPHTTGARRLFAEAFRDRAPVFSAAIDAIALVETGRPGEALETLATPPVSEDPVHSELVSYYRLMGLPLPDGRAESVLRVDACSEEPQSAERCLFHAGLFAVDQGRWEVVDRAVERIRSYTATAPDDVGGGGYQPKWVELVAETLEAYATWRHDGPDAALPRFREAQRKVVGSDPIRADTNALLRWFIAEIEAEAGRPAQAARYYESFWGQPTIGPFRILARLRLGQTYEAMGDADRATQAYRSFLAAWADAEPGLPQVDEARAGLERVAG